MSRPPKPVAVLKAEGKSHRTKTELAIRQAAEEANLTGLKLKEEYRTKSDPVAHANWLKVVKRLRLIGHDDDLYGPIINRYCVLLSEEQKFTEMRNSINEDLDGLRGQKDEYRNAGKIENYYKQIFDYQKNIFRLDSQIQTKRKMLLDIEKENILTVASSLRSIPKNAEGAGDPLAAALAGLDDDG